MRDSFWRFREAIWFMIRDMVRDSWRTSITFLNLLIFLCCFFCLAALAKAANEYGQQDGNQSSLIVMSKGVFNPSDSSITESEFTPIRSLGPGQIKVVSPLIFKLVKIDEFLIQVLGANRDEFTSVFQLNLLEGAWPEKPDEVVVSEGAMLLTKWKIGQTITIYGRPFRITGEIFAPGTKASSVWMTLPQAQALFETGNVFQFAWVVVADKADSDQVRGTLQTLQGLGDRYDVFYVDALYQQYSEALQGIKDISLVLVLFALAMVTFGTYGSVYLTLSERAREITILRAIGFSTRTIRGLLTLRSMILVIAALISAWLVSALLLARFNEISPLTINSLPLPVTINWQTLLIGLGLSILFSCIGVLLPTIRLDHSTVHESIQR